MRFLIVFCLIFGFGCVSTRPMVQLSFPEAREFQLENGLRVLSLDDPSIPLVSVYLGLPVGSAYDIHTIPGTANFVAEMLDKGSVNRGSSREVANAFADLGTNFSYDVSREWSYFSTTGLESDFGELISLFADVITRPTFTTSEMERTRRVFLNQFERILDRPGLLANFAIDAIHFPESHPFRHQPEGTRKDVSAIEKKHLIQHYLTYIRPNVSTLVVVGRLPEGWEAEVKSAFRGWESRDVNLDIDIPQVEAVPGTRYFLDWPNLSQFHLRWSFPSLAAENPEINALQVGEQVFAGSGLGSRVFKILREERGLTYGMSSQMSSFRNQSQIRVSASGRLEVVNDMLDGFQEVWEEARTGGFTRREISSGRALLVSSFSLGLETLDRLAIFLLRDRVLGRMNHTVYNYLERIQSVSYEEINRVFGESYAVDKSSALLLGPKQPLSEQLNWDDWQKIEIDDVI